MGFKRSAGELEHEPQPLPGVMLMGGMVLLFRWQKRGNGFCLWYAPHACDSISRGEIAKDFKSKTAKEPRMAGVIQKLNKQNRDRLQVDSGGEDDQTKTRILIGR